MSFAINGEFRGVRWDEQVFAEAATGPKLAKAEIENRYDGDLSATGRLEYLLVYAPSGDVRFEGYERVTGSIGTRKGAFILRHEGVFTAAKGVDGKVQVLDDSGVEDFQGIAGRGTIRSNPGEHHGVYTLTGSFGGDPKP
jgi:hypothetical protein